MHPQRLATSTQSKKHDTTGGRARTRAMPVRRWVGLASSLPPLELPIGGNEIGGWANAVTRRPGGRANYHTDRCSALRHFNPHRRLYACHGMRQVARNRRLGPIHALRRLWGAYPIDQTSRPQQDPGLVPKPLCGLVAAYSWAGALVGRLAAHYQMGSGLCAGGLRGDRMNDQQFKSLQDDLFILYNQLKRIGVEVYGIRLLLLVSIVQVILLAAILWRLWHLG